MQNYSIELNFQKSTGIDCFDNGCSKVFGRLLFGEYCISYTYFKLVLKSRENKVYLLSLDKIKNYRSINSTKHRKCFKISNRSLPYQDVTVK